MEQSTIVVTGSAQRRVDPDRFVLVGRVAVRAADRSSAHAGLAQRFAALDQSVLALGAEDMEVRRGPVRSWGEPGRLQRWWAERSLTLTCRDPERVTEVVGAFGRVPDVALDGPTWVVDADHPVAAELQTEAVRDARRRAERYAVALGGELGRLVELRDHSSGSFAIHELEAVALKGGLDDGGIDGLDLSPEPSTIHTSVETRWALVLP
jgi:uncharacterized protein YggE